MSIHSYRELSSGKRASSLATDVYRRSRALPLRDHKAIGNQLQKRGGVDSGEHR